MYCTKYFHIFYLSCVYYVVGMDGTKHQSIFQSTEKSGLKSRALPGHDFCDSRLYITPSAYRFLSYEVKDVDGKRE